MSDDSKLQTTPIAVRLPRDPSRCPTLDRFLQDRGWLEVNKFEPKDDDELNDRLRAAEFKTVIFESSADLLDMLWTGHADMDTWPGVRVEFATPPAGDESTWRAMLRDVLAAYEHWQANNRRRRLIAGCILTAVGLAAMGVLLIVGAGGH